MFGSNRRGEKRSSPVNCQLSTVNCRRGSLLLDALLSVAIFGLVVASFSTGITGSQQGTVRGGSRVRATHLAEETIEVLRSIRDGAGGFAILSARPLDQDDGVALVGNGWSIVENPTLIDGAFTRKVRFSAGPDSNTRKVTSTVTWTELSGNQTLSYSDETYITNWHNPPPPPPPDWSQPIFKGSVPSSMDSALEEATLEDVEVKGNYAFAADSGSAGHGLIIYDVSNITSPSFSSAVPMASAFDIAISGNYAYLATNDLFNELKIVDISGAPIVSCCANQIDLAGAGVARGISIIGTKLYISREISSGPELYVYDIGASPTNPPLIASIESDPAARNMYATTATSSPYVYIATNYTVQELTVASTATSSLTGGGDAPNGGSPQTGNSVIVFNNGVFLGVKGDNLCELFAFDISVNPQDPNSAPPCGGNQAYDVNVGGASEPSESVNDMATSTSLTYAFIAAHTKDAGGVAHYFHVLDVSNPNDIASASKKIYSGNITLGFESDKGIFYRQSDHAVFMVGGAEFSPGSDLIILQPTYSY